MKDKINASLEIERVQQEWLQDMAAKYQLPGPLQGPARGAGPCPYRG